MGLLHRFFNRFQKKPDPILPSVSSPSVKKSSETTVLSSYQNIIIENTPDKEREIPDIYICRTCGKSFETEADLLKHKSQISEYESPESVSDSSVTTKNLYLSHTHITNAQIPCYDQILKFDEDIEKFLCKSCGRTFLTEEELLNHIHAPNEILAVPNILINPGSGKTLSYRES